MCHCVQLLQLIKATVFRLFLKGEWINHCLWFASGEMEVQRAESSVTKSYSWYMKEGDRSRSPETGSNVWSTPSSIRNPGNHYKLSYNSWLCILPRKCTASRYTVYVSAITPMPRFCVLSLFFPLTKGGHSEKHTVAGDTMRGWIISGAVLSSCTCEKHQKFHKNLLPLYGNDCKAVPSVSPK